MLWKSPESNESLKAAGLRESSSHGKQRLDAIKHSAREPFTSQFWVVSYGFVVNAANVEKVCGAIVFVLRVSVVVVAVASGIREGSCSIRRCAHVVCVSVSRASCWRKHMRGAIWRKHGKRTKNKEKERVRVLKRIRSSSDWAWCVCE